MPNPRLDAVLAGLATLCAVALIAVALGLLA